MKMRNAITALGVSALITLGAGCAQDDVVADAAVAETPPAVGVAADPVVEPVVGADPAAVAPGAAIGDAGVADRPTFGAWDSNADGLLDNNEFRTRFNDGDWYGDWDGDRNGTLSTAEFGAVNTAWGDAPGGVDTNGLFDVWDSDEDGLIGNDEAATGAFTAWDRDRNNTIDPNEFNAGVNWFD
ncbi:EF-hand domain-containing protein [Lysobacter korlensis]|uniref:EF-hand domain-containing protein n=1 Tax=Lysobacter korlensis TaxID=553636 RepID=A0ABV6RKZ5_9GAMM